MSQAGKERFSARDGETFCRLLRVFRGVLEALVAFADQAGRTR